jgi:hypothetical protein
MLRLGGDTGATGRMNPSANLSFTKKNFGWMDVRELNPERMGSLWLKASVTGEMNRDFFFSIILWYLPCS